ncbi:MAG: DoxX family protein [Saprospiraceae bacterium]
MNASSDIGKLILRISIGGLMIFHGIDKLGGIGFIIGKFTELGFPGFLGYLVYLGELIAPLLLLIGFRSKIAGLLVSATMVVAVLLVHAGDIFALGSHGESAIEVQLLYFLGGLAIYFLGGGRLAVSSNNRWD